MGRSAPQEVSLAFAAAVRERDLDAALELWAPDPLMVGPEGTALRGREAIAAGLRALLEHCTDFRVEIGPVHTAGDVAVASGNLLLTAGDPPHTERSSATVIYRRGEDGLWRLAIDAPWGLPLPATVGER